MTERQALVRLEVIRLEMAHVQARLMASSADLLVDGLLREVVTLRRERQAIVDALGIGAEVESEFAKTGKK